MNYVRLLTNSESVTVNYSLALSASHLVTYTDDKCVRKSYPADLMVIYTQFMCCHAATEQLQKKQVN